MEAGRAMRPRSELIEDGKFLVNKLRTALLLISFFIMLSQLVGCIDVPTKKTTYEEELIVHCLLRTDMGPSNVYVERTLDIHETATEIAVRGATVHLSGDNREVIFTEIASRPGVYRCPAQFPLRNDSTYTIDVSDPTGRSVSATTTVPGHFHLLSPAIPESIDTDRDLELIWSSSSGAQEYHILASLACGGSEWRLVSYVFSDTTLIIPAWQLDTDIPFECNRLWIRIYAVDENYAGYTRSDPEDAGSPDINHIPGAKGVFGSATHTFGLFYVK